MRRYRDSRYGQRWQVETVMSMIKRRQGGHVLGPRTRRGLRMAKGTILFTASHTPSRFASSIARAKSSAR
jgi:hypothetical protein